MSVFLQACWNSTNEDQGITIFSLLQEKTQSVFWRICWCCTFQDQILSAKFFLTGLSNESPFHFTASRTKLSNESPSNSSTSQTERGDFLFWETGIIFYRGMSQFGTIQRKPQASSFEPDVLRSSGHKDQHGNALSLTGLKIVSDPQERKKISLGQYVWFLTGENQIRLLSRLMVLHSSK